MENQAGVPLKMFHFLLPHSEAQSWPPSSGCHWEKRSTVQPFCVGPAYISASQTGWEHDLGSHLSLYHTCSGEYTLYFQYYCQISFSSLQ